VDATTAALLRPRSKPVRVSLTILYFVGISVIVGWSLRDGAAASQHAGPPPMPVASDQGPVDTASAAIAAGARLASLHEGERVIVIAGLGKANG
jgi:hypothetical protein